MIWGLKGKSMAKECESKKGRAEETELTSGGTENQWGEEKPLCETGYSWDAKGLSSYGDRLWLRETG